MKKIFLLILAGVLTAYGAPTTPVNNAVLQGTTRLDNVTNGAQITGPAGAVNIAAGGTNQNIQLDASGTGFIGVKPSGFRFGSTTALIEQSSGQLAINDISDPSPALILQELGVNSGYFSTNAGAARLNGQASLALTVDDTGGRIDIGAANGNIVLTPNGTGRTIANGGAVFSDSTKSFKANADASFDAVGFGPTVFMRRAGTSYASPSAVTSAQSLFNLIGQGHNGTTFVSGGVFNVTSTENWSGTATGAKINFGITPNTTTGTANTWAIDQDGGLKMYDTFKSVGLQLYNAADQTTNYERLGLRWSGNVAIIESTAAGSGTNRPLSIFTGGVAALTIDASQNSVFSGSVLSRISVNLKTQANSPYSVLTTESGRLFSNEGSTAQVIFNLPAPAVGLTYTFIVQDTDGIRVQASTGTRIRIAGQLSAVSGNVEAAASGDTVTLVAINALEWMSIATNGTWVAN